MAEGQGLNATEAEMVNGADVFALDLGGSKLALATVSRAGELTRHVRTPTAGIPDGDALVAWVAEQTRGWALAPAALGISAGGPLDDVAGKIVSWPRMEHLWGYPLADKLMAAIPSLKAVKLVNDASAACAGEAVFGAARGLKRSIYLTVSTGVGGGAVVGALLLRGELGNAAEFGHMIVDPNGPICDCGQQGCLEAVSSGAGLYRRAVEAGLVNADEMGWAQMGYWLAERLEHKDPAALELWRRALDGLAVGITNLYNCFVPQAIVLGGGLSALVQQDEEALQALLEQRARLIPLPEGVVRFSANRDTIPLLGVAAVAGGWIGQEA